MRFKKLFLVYLLTLMIFSIPLLGGKEKKAYELIYEDIQVIKKQLKALENKVESNSKRIDEIYELVKTLSTQMLALQRVQADLTQNNEYFQSQLQLIIEKLDETNKQLVRTQEELIALKTSSESLSEKQTEEAGVAQPSEEKKEEVVPKEQEAPSVFISPQQIYNTAYSDYLKGNYQLAIEGFRQYIENFRESPLADNAQYWIGECYFLSLIHI